MSIDYQHILHLAKNGEWDKAHQAVQPKGDELSCLIHAYLHRVEGDMSNTNYWYRQAGETMPDNSLEEEFNRLTAMAEKAMQ